MKNIKHFKFAFFILSLFGLIMSSCGPTSSSSSSLINQGDSSTLNSSITTTSSQKYDIISISEALEIGQNAPSDGTSEKYYVTGTIQNVDNTTYGNMTIADDTGELYIYGLYNFDGSIRYDSFIDKPVEGDEVILYGVIANYKGTIEMKNAWLIEHKVQEHPPITYENYTIEEARKLDNGIGVILKGYVASIRLGGGYSPAGFILVDEKSSIYIFTSDASKVSVGNKVTIQGIKDYWILEDEVSSAQKFGYKGANQIGNASVIENDNQVHSLPMSWVEETTVKNLLNIPVENDITSLVYKVNAQIIRQQGTGFINYYINDFDGTGSYIYTNNNGNELDDELLEYDGKLCTLYITALNAKCDTSGTLYRFMIVDIISDSYTMPEEQFPEFALDYYVINQFNEKYQSDPAISLIQTVNNDILNFSGVNISYSSSNNNIFEIAEENNELKFHWTGIEGESVITMNATYNNYQATRTLTIKGEDIGDIETSTIEEVIEGNYGETYTVRGIAAGSYPHALNKGFMLVDETGVLAIITTDEIMKDIAQGNEVIFKGEKYNYGEAGNTKGTICLRNAVLVQNLYGEHEYSKNAIKKASVSELYNLDVTIDHSFELYEVNAIVEFERAQHYTNVKIKSEDGSSSVRLYTNNGDSNYGWVEKLANKVIKLHLIPINWNSKNYYTYVLIMASDGVTTLYNETTFGR